MRDARSRRRAFACALLLLALLHAWLAASVSDELGVSSDEIAHLTAGTAYWREHDYRLQPENGLLPQRLAGLPLAFSSDVIFPDVRGEPTAIEAWARGSVWDVGAQFLFESGNEVPSLLLRARWMIAVVGSLGVLLIGAWAARIGGHGAGLFAAALAALSPTWLAHAGLATSDTAAAVGFLGATAACWALCHRVTPARVATTGLAAGLLALCKYSAILLAPIVLLLVAVRLMRRTRLPIGIPGAGPFSLRGWRRLPALLGGFVAAATLAVVVIWAGYGFRYSAAGPMAPEGARFDMSWDRVLMSTISPSTLRQADGTEYLDVRPAEPGVVQQFIHTARHFRALPEAWLYGLGFVERHSRHRGAFLAGDWRMTGWWWFFPFAALIKSTPVELTLFFLALASVAALARSRASDRRCAYRCLAPLAAILVYGWVALGSELNIGHRHILPVYGFMFVLVGACVVRASQRVSPRSTCIVAAALLAGQAVASLGIRPHYLAYFNFLVGGPDSGHRYLVDSSLDWGQGLPSLARWLEKNQAPGERLFLSYFGSDRPDRFGLEATRIADTYFDQKRETLVVDVLRPGLYVFSATMWQRVYTHVRGPWTESLERAYHEQLAFWFLDTKPAWSGHTRETLSGTARGERLTDFDHLRFGRLCHALRDRQPDAIVAHQYLVFRLSEEDLRSALYGPLKIDATQ